MQRTILVILSNRVNATRKPRHLELLCDDKGTILKERPLKSAPRTPKYDEVWENDEGRADMDSCHRFRRHYRHPLVKPKA